jgi:N-dimethylarginine dimethylaminohydrolase
MTWSVYQHWDPLKVCVVGRSYPPEFYSWITVPHVRTLFEQIAVETEEDYQRIINTLEHFGVKVLRPELPVTVVEDGKFVPPPMTPRDYMIMIGNVFYHHCHNSNQYQHIIKTITQQNNCVVSDFCDRFWISGSNVTPLGRDLYFGTPNYQSNTDQFANLVQKQFVNTRNHIINTGGHSDATFCPVAPGLIFSVEENISYKTTFPGWEVIHLSSTGWDAIPEFQKLKQQNRGRWWISGFEKDQSVIDTVEQWLGHWAGYVEETVFDINMLIIDPKNVAVFNYNKTVFDALERYGITPHVVPFRHRYFWDGGIHCVTSDLHREGVLQDFFPERDSV